MIIHTKEKTKIHIHENRDAKIKGHNVYMVDHSPMSKGSTTKQIESVNQGKKSFRKSTIHQNRLRNLNPVSQYRQKLKDSNRSVKVKNSTIKNAGLISASTTVNQLEGGEEIRNSAMIASTIARPVTGSASKGAALFRKKVLDERKAKIKKVEAGKKLGRKKIRDTAAGSVRKLAKDSAKKASKDSAKFVAKESAKVGAKVAGTATGTAATGPAGPLIGLAVGEAVGFKLDRNDVKRTNRNRKLKFFFDKLKSEDNQTESFAKLVKDLIFKQASVAIKYIIKYVGIALLILFLLIAVAVLPVILVIAIIYNSPLAIFFPPLESGDTVMSVTSQYEAEFNRDVNTLASNHTGYDDGIVVYVDYEGMSASPSNYYDIMAVYMVKYGVGDTATIMNDTSKAKLKSVFDDMCSYTTTSETETVENEDGTTSSTTVLHVNVTLKSYRDMISIYNFNSDEVELLEITMDPKNLALIGYTGGTGGGNAVSELSQAEITTIVSGITDAKAKQTCTYALNKVGYPYSQDYRDSGNYYDCSSLAYYSWKAAGIDISYGGATTAAAEGQGLDEAGKTVSYEEIRPGDLIFYSYCSNGRYKNISHVAIYVGNGKAVEALNETVGVIYRDVSTGSIVMIGRP
ncbi:Cell wall-associated hydrolase, NlpC family [[Clostridium] fimetarium]|uniref:Cell wall-associated hydrolase, NlpC family n=2 Tax=[Clostridium] fimetarium TaxID=99656 RepID=A0A1I0MAB0_9FIRM|nr:Cell wall-associated hydrolase, NlpC family [[Clostridium] fimetarium]